MSTAASSLHLLARPREGEVRGESDGKVRGLETTIERDERRMGCSEGRAASAVRRGVRAQCARRASRCTGGATIEVDASGAPTPQRGLVLHGHACNVMQIWPP